MAPRPTLVSLAKDLGVSRQSVSNAINRPEVVARETLERVLVVIEQTNYRPMRAARQLRTKNSRTIAVRIMPEYDGISGHILNHFNHQIAQTAGEFQYRMITLVARDNGDEVANYAEMFNDGDIDGVILSSTTLGDERPARLLIERGATAIVCASDSLALGALPVCQASGAALIGFDGAPVARALAMNSVEQPVGDVAITAFHMLFDVMQDRAAVRHTLLTPQLVLRNRLDVGPVF